MTTETPATPPVAPDSEASGRKQSSLLFWLVVGAAALVIVIGVVFSQRFGEDPQPLAFAVKGQEVGALELPLLEEEGTLDFADLRGDIVVVNFWASWCLNCRVEHETLVRGAEEYASGVTFVGVNHQDTTDNAVAFLDELGRSTETIYARDVGSRAALEFGVLGLPETYFVDQDGTIVGKVIGPVSPQVLTDTIDAIVLGEDVGVVKTGEVENREG